MEISLSAKKIFLEEKMENFSMKQVKITEGFFEKRQTLNGSSTLKNVYERFKETGRFKALKCTGEEPKAHIYWDSDVAKWLEAAAYFLYRKEDGQIRAWYEEAVNDILENQLETGYFNSYFQVYEKENIFTRRNDHELYCAGHLFEAAVASSEYLKDDRLLVFAEKYVDYIYERFVVKQDTGFKTPGHEEIELALFRLYSLTKKEKYKELAEFFLDVRGTVEAENTNEGINGRYSQSHLPLREQTSAVGHAVRALYLYTAMADMAKLSEDEGMKRACENLFEDIVKKKMYVTGGTGSVHGGERFTVDYDLPNFKAYSETCASIALVFFSDRMLRLTGEAKYGHILERALYNGALAGVSLDGSEFFYVNPLEMQAERTKHLRSGWTNEPLPIMKRLKVFNCSCCPPNVCRFMEEIPQYIWYADEKTNVLTLSLHVSSELKSELADVSLQSGFPYNGKVKMRVNSHGKKIIVRVRKPEWCAECYANEQEGYLVYEGVFANEEIEIEFPMRIKAIYANANIPETAGKTAFSYGPLVLCAEGTDNKFPLFGVKPKGIEGACVTVDERSPFALKATLPAILVGAGTDLYVYELVEEEVTLTLIPYFAWANREENDMRVWF